MTGLALSPSTQGEIVQLVLHVACTGDDTPLQPLDLPSSVLRPSMPAPIPLDTNATDDFLARMQYTRRASAASVKHSWFIDKTVLTQHAPYFSAMFAHDFLESTACYVVLPESVFTVDSVHCLLKFMHEPSDWAVWVERHATDVLLCRHTSPWSMDDMMPDASPASCSTSNLSNSSPSISPALSAVFSPRSSSPTPPRSLSPMMTPSWEDDFMIYLLLDIYAAADYLGMTTLCMHAKDMLAQNTHQWTCYCQECVSLLPTLYAATYQVAQCFDWLHDKVIHMLTNDPEKALPGFWTQRSLAYLLTMAANEENAKSIAAVAASSPVPPSPSPIPPSTLEYHPYGHPPRCHSAPAAPIHPLDQQQEQQNHQLQHQHQQQLVGNLALMLSRRLCQRVNKTNAIESLHGCFIATQLLATHDPLVAWSRTLHAAVTSVQAKATIFITRYFEYYCTQYPALLSCVDGITYSFEFLEYMLMHMLEDQMDLDNCGLLYQGIVRDLICRHSVQYHDQVRHVLSVAKQIIVQYMSTRIDRLFFLGSLDVLDTRILKSLSIDLDVPAKQLVRALDRHPGLEPPSLKHILFPSPKITYRRTANASSLAMRRTLSLQSGASLPTSYVSVTSNHSVSLASRFKQWCQSSTSVTLSVVPTSSSLFSWTSVSLKSAKKKKTSLWHTLSLVSKKVQPGHHQKSTLLVVGKRVQLLRRPVLTVGTVKYMGPVCFATGLWVGVELDRRVGKNDGSVDGQRYFTTSPNRGVFVRSDDVKVVL
ncbi:hypothetical protein BC940DRAFT_303896 [Gongronella butleri]|nr:hypothetical protein BC940DRAFT_303896 [Gongronella butleri]